MLILSKAKLIFMFASTLLSVTSGVTNISLYEFRQVDNRLPTDYNLYCLMGSFVGVVTSKLQCLTGCGTLQNCTMVCYNGTTCKYYDTYTSFYWNTSNYPAHFLESYGNMKCYTSYLFDNDVTHKIIDIKTKNDADWEVLKNNSISGASCKGRTRPWASGGIATPWLEVQLDQEYTITKIIANARYHTGGTFFQNVEIRVGNTAGVIGNFASQTLFASYTGPAPIAARLTFTKTPGIPGKFVSLKKITGTEIIVEDFKVFA